MGEELLVISYSLLGKRGKEVRGQQSVVIG